MTYWGARFFRRSPVILALAPMMLAQAPPEYQDLYDELSGNIADFRSAVNSGWDGTKWPVTFSAQLLSANAHLGPELLTEDHYTAVLLELDGLKALGVQGVSIEIPFPILYFPFHGSGSVYQQYLDFYKRLAVDVRARGLKVIVESQVVFNDPLVTSLDVGPFYASLDWTEYKKGRTYVVVTIARELNPDYLSVVVEPDTEAAQTGQDVGTVAGSTELLNAILDGLQRVGLGTGNIGAGVGTWEADYVPFIESYASTPIGFISVHVYPSGYDLLTRAITIADTARAYGKDVGVGETWLFKLRESELPTGGYIEAFRRNVFSFWASLDAEFLHAMVSFSHYKQLAFLSPYFSGYFRGYVEYGDATKDQPYSVLAGMAQDIQGNNISLGKYNGTGVAYESLITGLPDVSPPLPPEVTAQATSPTTAAISWTVAQDNVGTATYVVARNGVPLAQTAYLGYLDSGLSDGVTYNYRVKAFDVAGNPSAWSAPAEATTPDVTAPALPRQLRASAVSCAQIDLSWLASTDNVGVALYRVYRGSVPSPPPTEQDGSATAPATTYSDRNLAAQTKYCYDVGAVDARNNQSTPSNVACATTPAAADITPPTVTVTGPASGGVESGMVTLLAAASDIRTDVCDVASGVAGVQFKIDGVNVLAEVTAPPYYVRWDSRTVPNGVHVVTAVGRDNAGRVTVSAPVSFTVGN